MSDWFPPGVLPEQGERYEFQDFVGACFVGTFDRYLSLSEPAGGGMALMMEDREPLVLRLEFTDRQPFETNVPIRFRALEAREAGQA